MMEKEKKIYSISQKIRMVLVFVLGILFVWISVKGIIALYEIGVYSLEEEESGSDLFDARMEEVGLEIIKLSFNNSYYAAKLYADNYDCDYIIRKDGISIGGSPRKDYFWTQEFRFSEFETEIYSFHGTTVYSIQLYLLSPAIKNEMFWSFFLTQNGEALKVLFPIAIVGGIFMAVSAFTHLIRMLKGGEKKAFKDTIWWQIGIVLKRGCIFLGRAIGKLPLIWKTTCAVVLISLLEIIVLIACLNCGENAVSKMVLVSGWFVEKIILVPFVLLVSLKLRTLKIAGNALAEGNLAYQVDESRLFWDLKEHGSALNRISEGVNIAVQERIKSEHFKTELITNVSHDIKTPLTSIINYSDLLCKEETDNERIKEYAEVLHRQSGRLKKLIEDLMEASKASTGNIEVKLEACEVGVLLEQAVGEFDTRFYEKNMDVITKISPEPLKIMADGRLLWRVFDNLLNNICKYAQGGTRVYLSVEKIADNAVVTFKNISKYPLDITEEELMERFVRGDKSRHTEGNGLGLNIAKSLVELQKGTMKLIIDGDLFKVILSFPTIE